MRSDPLVRRGVIGQTGTGAKEGRMTSGIRVALLIAGLLGAAACSREAGDGSAGNAAEDAANVVTNAANAVAPAAKLAIVAESGGLQLGDGEGRELRFGTSQEETLDRLAPLGRPPVETNAECGAGPMQIGRWPNGLTLLFQEGRFVGWMVQGDAANGIRSRRGIGTGATRGQLAAGYPGVTIDESTLGTEFDADGIGGLLDGDAEDARVTSLWAGTTCHFR
jgi:hypothetical protein